MHQIIHYVSFFERYRKMISNMSCIYQQQKYEGFPISSMLFLILNLNLRVHNLTRWALFSSEDFETV